MSQPLTAQEEIFADDFEAGRTCWVWSASAGGTDLCFDAPYLQAPPIGSFIIDEPIDPPPIDVVIGLDTTGSMDGEIQNLKNSIGTLIDEINVRIPDSGFAVSGYDDFPLAPYGSGPDGDLAFYLLHRLMTASTPAGKASIANAVDLYETHNGMDVPESGWEMVYQVATGAGNGTGPFAVPPFDSGTTPPGTIPTGEETGEIGGVGFRSTSRPMIVWITDVPSHNSGVSGYPYGLIPGVDPATDTQAVAAMNAIGGKIIGVYSTSLAKPDLTFGAVATHTTVTPEAWGTADRPPGCAPGECCTGLNGTGVPPSTQGRCPLVFEISNDGAGLSAAIIDGIDRLRFSGTYDIGAVLTDDPNDGVDAVAAFVERLEALETAPPPCTSGLTAIDDNGDSVLDTFVDVPPDSIVCFDLVLKTNDTVPPTVPPEVFGATFGLIRDGVTVTDRRGVFFRVPE